MLTPYPTSLAPEEWQAVVAILRGEYPDKARAVHLVWDAAGYAAGQFLPDNGSPPPLMAASSNPAPTHAQLADSLESLHKAGDMKAFAFDWQALILALLKDILPIILQS